MSWRRDRRLPSRCHLRTVAGWIGTKEECHRLRCRQSQIQSTRSADRRSGLVCSRYSTENWWRRTAFSAAREVRGRAMPVRALRTGSSHEIMVPQSMGKGQEVNSGKANEIFAECGPLRCCLLTDGGRVSRSSRFLLPFPPLEGVNPAQKRFEDFFAAISPY